MQIESELLKLKKKYTKLLLANGETVISLEKNLDNVVRKNFLLTFVEAQQKYLTLLESKIFKIEHNIQK